VNQLLEDVKEHSMEPEVLVGPPPLLTLFDSILSSSPIGVECEFLLNLETKNSKLFASLVQYVDHNGQNVLHYCCNRESYVAAEFFLRKKANPSQYDLHGRHPLDLIVMKYPSARRFFNLFGEYCDLSTLKLRSLPGSDLKDMREQEQQQPSYGKVRSLGQKPKNPTTHDGLFHAVLLRRYCHMK
jgi:hypothetical protein